MKKKHLKKYGMKIKMVWMCGYHFLSKRCDVKDNMTCKLTILSCFNTILYPLASKVKMFEIKK